MCTTFCWTLQRSEWKSLLCRHNQLWPFLFFQQCSIAGFRCFFQGTYLRRIFLSPKTPMMGSRIVWIMGFLSLSLRIRLVACIFRVTSPGEPRCSLLFTALHIVSRVSGAIFPTNLGLCPRCSTRRTSRRFPSWALYAHTFWCRSHYSYGSIHHTLTFSCSAVNKSWPLFGLCNNTFMQITSE